MAEVTSWFVRYRETRRTEMRKALIGIFVACLSGGVAIAQEEAPAQTLITNVQIFDGVNEKRMAGNVLVEGNLIKQISAQSISAPNATV
jgi:adenine deaminase